MNNTIITFVKMQVAHTLYTHRSCVPSGMVVPSARITLSNAKPNVLSDFSLSKLLKKVKTIKINYD